MGKRSVAGYVGEILEKVGDEGRVYVYKRIPQGTYVKPEEPDMAVITEGQIVAVLPKPSSAGTTARTLGSISFSKHPEAIGNADLR